MLKFGNCFPLVTALQLQISKGRTIYTVYQTNLLDCKFFWSTDCTGQFLSFSYSIQTLELSLKLGIINNYRVMSKDFNQERTFSVNLSSLIEIFLLISKICLRFPTLGSGSTELLPLIKSFEEQKLDVNTCILLSDYLEVDFF